MAAGVAEKRFTDLFPLCPLRKNDIPKMKKNRKNETYRALKGILIFKRSRKSDLRIKVINLIFLLTGY